MRGIGSNREERRGRPQVRSGPRNVCHLPNSWTPRCVPQVRSVIATKSFGTLNDAEASALAAGRPQGAAAGRRRRVAARLPQAVRGRRE